MEEREQRIPSGAGAAAVLAAGIGAFALAVTAIAADRVASVQKLLIFYRPTGPLSGVTTSAIVVWLAAWFALDRLWRRREIAMGRVAAAAFVLLALAFLRTFPPLADLL